MFTTQRFRKAYVRDKCLDTFCSIHSMVQNTQWLMNLFQAQKGKVLTKTTNQVLNTKNNVKY